MVHGSEQPVAATPNRFRDRVVLEVVAAGGEMMLLLAFLAAGIVLSTGSGRGPVSLEGPWVLVTIAVIGVTGAGLALGSARSGRLVLENWGANISLLAAVVLLFRLYLPVAALWTPGALLTGVDLTPFLAGVIAISVLRTALFAGKSIIVRLRGEESEGREGDWQILRGRWIFAAGMLGLLLIVEAIQ